MSVVLLSSDLSVLSRIEGITASRGKSVRIVSASLQAIEVCKTEAIELLVVDLSRPALDIVTLIHQLRSGHGVATRVVAFGPHVHENRLAAARGAGCDVVVSRGQFFAQLESILSSEQK
jgi:CheY-like chemotaxis protein